MPNATYPPTLYFCIYLLGDMIFYLLLTWYFDNIVESNRGKSSHPLFFISCFNKSSGTLE